MLTNERAEEDVIGLLMRNPDQLPECAEMIGPKDFGVKLCGEFFARMIELRRDGKQLIAAAMIHGLQDKYTESLNVWLARVRKDAPEGVTAVEVAALILDSSVRRSAKAMAEKLAKDVIGGEVRDTLVDFQQDLGLLLGRTEVSSATVGQLANNIVARAMNPPDVPRGITTGMGFIDAAIGSMLPEDLVVLGGVTSMGKTALGQQIAYHVAAQGIPVDFLTLEQPADQVTARMLSQLSNVPVERIETGQMSPAETQALKDAQVWLSGLPLRIEDVNRAKAKDLLTKVQANQAKFGTRLVIVDHLHYVQLTSRPMSKADALSTMIQEIKQAAKDTKIPWVGLAHVNRESGKRENRRPVLGDLFGASEFEKSADSVLFVHREQYWLEMEQVSPGAKGYEDWLIRMERARGRAEIVVGKRRRGKGKGVYECLFVEEAARFEEPLPDNQPRFL